jgi:hypothetical protein
MFTNASSRCHCQFEYTRIWLTLPFLADLCGKHRAKSIPPVQHNFMANVDPMLVPQVIDIAQRKWKSNVHYAHQADDLGAAVKVLEGVCFGHQRRLRNRPTRLKQILF